MQLKIKVAPKSRSKQGVESYWRQHGTFRKGLGLGLAAGKSLEILWRSKEPCCPFVICDY